MEESATEFRVINLDIDPNPIEEKRPLALNPLLKAALDRIDDLYNDVIPGINEDIAISPQTRCALSIVEYAIAHAKSPLLVFSMDTDAVSFATHMISSIGQIKKGKLFTGDVEEDDWPKIAAAIGKMKDRQIYIDDSPSLSPQDIRTQAQRVISEQGKLGMILVDQLQMMQVDDYEQDIRGSMKTIANELDCSLVALTEHTNSTSNIDVVALVTRAGESYEIESLLTNDGVFPAVLKELIL